MTTAQDFQEKRWLALVLLSGAGVMLRSFRFTFQLP